LRRRSRAGDKALPYCVRIFRRSRLVPSPLCGRGRLRRVNKRRGVRGSCRTLRIINSNRRSSGACTAATPHPFFFAEPLRCPLPIRAFTPIFDGLWGEGASTTTALAVTSRSTNFLTQDLPTLRLRVELRAEPECKKPGPNAKTRGAGPRALRNLTVLFYQIQLSRVECKKFF
jgi:hypothetical protein